MTEKCYDTKINLSISLKEYLSMCNMFPNWMTDSKCTQVYGLTAEFTKIKHSVHNRTYNWRIPHDSLKLKTHSSPPWQLRKAWPAAAWGPGQCGDGYGSETPQLFPDYGNLTLSNHHRLAAPQYQRRPLYGNRLRHKAIGNNGVLSAYLSYAPRGEG